MFKCVFKGNYSFLQEGYVFESVTSCRSKALEPPFRTQTHCSPYATAAVIQILSPMPNFRALKISRKD